MSHSEPTALSRTWRIAPVTIKKAQQWVRRRMSASADLPSPGSSSEPSHEIRRNIQRPLPPSGSGLVAFGSEYEARDTIVACVKVLCDGPLDAPAAHDVLLFTLCAKLLDETTGDSILFRSRRSPSATASAFTRMAARTVRWLRDQSGEQWQAPVIPEHLVGCLVERLERHSLMLTAARLDGPSILRALFAEVATCAGTMPLGSLPTSGSPFARTRSTTALLDYAAFKSRSAELRVVAVAVAKAFDQLGSLKERNLDWMRGNYKRGDSSVTNLPKLIHVELSTACNIRCRICSITRPGRNRKPMFLDLSTLEKLRPELPFISDCKIHGGGEPFLHPDIDRIVEIFGEEGVRLNTVSNANLITERLARLIGGTFSSLTVSVDGADRAVYEYVRVRAKWDKLLRGLGYINEYRQPDFRLIIGVVLLKCNIHQLPDLVRFTKEHGAQELQAAWLVPFHDLPWTQSQRLTDDPERTNYYMDAARAMGQELGISVRIPDNLRTSDASPTAIACSRGDQGDERGADRAGTAVSTIANLAHKDTYRDLHGTTRVEGHCRLMYDRCMILVDGQVKPCGQSQSVPELGSVHDRSLFDCWNSSGYQRLRSTFNQGTLPVTCRSCNFIRSKQLGTARLVYD